MATFLVTYYGGGPPPESPAAREQMMAAFQAWAAGAGDAIIDPGAPLGPRRTVTGSGVSEDPADAALGGYTVLRADSLDDAVKVVESHPFVSRGGTLQVSQVVAP